MSSYRLSHGGLIDRSRPVSFKWQGRSLTGYSGDTLASALLGNGIALVGRSFKYHRPRGILAAGIDEPNAIVQLERGRASIPNLKTPLVELYEGMDAAPVNARPSVEFDLMAINCLFKRFIPAAFYYKTFMWPGWRWFEPSIRRAAGLGRAPVGLDPDTYTETSAHCETLIVGGGIAGLNAALAEGRRGKCVMMITGSACWGGRLAGTAVSVAGQPAQAWIDSALAELGAMTNITLCARTIATGYYDHNMLALCERLTDHQPLSHRAGPRQRLWKVRAGQVILATGAHERPLVFPNNDRPGVMLAGAAYSYLHRHGVAPGRRVVLATNNDQAWRTAFDLADAGVEIAAIADARPSLSDRLTDEACRRGIAVHPATVPVDVAGRRSVRGVTLSEVNTAGVVGHSRLHLRCDAVLVSGGWSPAVHLHSQAGGSLDFDEALASFVPDTARQAHCSIGAAAGDFGIDAALANRSPADTDLGRAAVRPIWSVSADGAPSADAFVDFQNDVTAADVALAARENFRSVEHLKRYTTLGMASDQGKTSNVNGIGIMSRLLDKPVAAVGTTRFRPPYDPTTIGVFAAYRVGEGLHPRRVLAAHDAHLAAGAVLEEQGGWMRPAVYMRNDEDKAAAVAREVLAVRNWIGLFDASPLGKIEVKGPDAADLLDRVYVNTISTLGIGRCRYVVMANENGVVYDDGIVARLADDHFLLGTTSGHAAAVAESLQEWLQCEWIGLRVVTEDVTSCWAVITIAGPRARQLLATLRPTIDLSAKAFPHMAHRTGTIAGMRCRIARVSFSGELSYEVAVPWCDGRRLWALLADAGQPLGATPFGIDALMTMRIEKGFLHVGSDTDGTTMPQDIGLAGLIEKKRCDFIGRRSTTRPDAVRPGRRQFVGLEVPGHERAPLRTGSHIVRRGGGAAAVSEGWVTSSAWSPSLGRPVALAMIRDGRMRLGETVEIWDLGEWRQAWIVEPCRLDPTGERLHV